MLMDNTRWMTLFIDFDRGHRATDPRDLAAALKRDTLAVKGEALMEIRLLAEERAKQVPSLSRSETRCGLF
jgi:hypothetical protein